MELPGFSAHNAEIRLSARPSTFLEDLVKNLFTSSFTLLAGSHSLQL